MNALRGKRLDFAFSERKNVPYRNYNRGWVGSHQPSSSERAFRRFAALGTVTAAILLVFTCATLIAKPLWSWKLGRRLASGKGLRDVQDGREDSLDICAPGETSNDQKSEPYPYTAMPPERAPKEVFLAKDIGKLAPRQAESAQLEMEPATDRSDARLRKDRPSPRSLKWSRQLTGPTPAVSVAPSPLDINLESLVDDEELILRSWFPEPPKDSRPASHFDSHFDTEATFSECEDLRCYREAGNGPTISSTDSGLRQSHPVGSSLAKVGSGTSDVTMQVIQAEPERSAEGESLAVVPALGTSNDISGHPFFRLPSVPPGLSARQFDVANITLSSVFPLFRRASAQDSSTLPT
ncbi:LOW QUALITY PROTEIN: uncharacterized protein EMH_0066780 [Eimeria mitis]|uniref:Transmembrane protein n=1 Tax=Eimeria mitis TaxID=44415 RepID=U6KH91_9EIME|nr:LOW QUALITY PROTEIN: uncharacterized protein EMH_0066780 [Eimeria mitis]CDJ36161.1 hypothetical protein, conserved [Eimeria mitis]